MKPDTIQLAGSSLSLTVIHENGQLRLERLAAGGGPAWLLDEGQSGLFGVTVGEQYHDASSLAYDGAREEDAGQGARRVILQFHGAGIEVEQAVTFYEDAALVEFCPLIRSTGSQAVRVERVDSLALDLAPGEAELLAYTGNWGSEFEPQRSPLAGEVILESRSGRSSKGHHPWFALERGSGEVLSAAAAWSGNWVFRFEPRGEGFRLTGGLHDWEFYKDLAPGETLQGAPVVLALGSSLNAVSQQYARVGRRHWYPRNELSARLPVEWNHWWSYEDVEINADVFQRNVHTAAPLGFEVCTLDAGWFGPSDAGTHWYEYRGDWDLVNQERFPQGIRPVAEDVHAQGMKFGIWCEIEGLGIKARLAQENPDYPALRDGQPLGYVCFGNPRVQDWAYETLAHLIRAYQADWIKLDFNLDPGAGCDRTDHGHGAGDGLYEHYQGYYRTLARLREDFPEVVLENCSSGGLRIDLGMLRATHMTFLSDPDWAVHDLQIFWGASTMLAPDVLLHWTYSHWRGDDKPPYQTFNPHDPDLTVKKWDYYTRISMLGLYGYSQKLPDLPEWMARRMAEHNRIYKDHVRRFVRQGDLYRLTGQPLRSGTGDRWAAFQYSLPDKSEHLLFVFRLPMAAEERAVRLQELDPERLYTLEGLEGEFHAQMSGKDLMENGLVFTDLEEEESALVRVV